MLDFDVGKLVVIGLVALIVIGPKDLPRVLRQVGQIVGKMRRMATEFQGQLMEAMREADIENLKKEMQGVADAAKVDVAFDPIRDVREQITSAVQGDAMPTAAKPPETPETGNLEIEDFGPTPEKLSVEAAFEDAPAVEAPKIEPAELQMARIESPEPEPAKLAEKRA